MSREQARLLSTKGEDLSKGLKKVKNYKISPVGAGLFTGAVLTKGPLSRGLHRATQIYHGTETSFEIIDIVRQAYQSEIFYKASWKIKARILARSIVRNTVIKTTISEIALSEIIYDFIKRDKNRQGNEKLAQEIEKELINHETESGL